MSFRGWVTFRAATKGDAQSRTAEPRRVFCAPRMFELSDPEFEDPVARAGKAPEQYGAAVRCP